MLSFRGVYDEKSFDPQKNNLIETRFLLTQFNLNLSTSLKINLPKGIVEMTFYKPSQ